MNGNEAELRLPAAVSSVKSAIQPAVSASRMKTPADLNREAQDASFSALTRNWVNAMKAPQHACMLTVVARLSISL